MSFNPPRVAEWQWLDESCGLWYPWYTIGALEEISSWDLSGKIIWEYGGGNSSLWWAKKAALVHTVESDFKWFGFICNKSEELNMSNLIPYLEEVNEGDQANKHRYVNRLLCANESPDIIIADGIFRYEVMEMACGFKRPITLIVDNYQQDYVFICPAAEELMKDYKGQFFTQPDHTNHEGRPWTTAIWHLK